MHTEEHFDTTVKAVTGLVLSVVTGAGAFMGMPVFLTPEVIAATASAISALAGVYYLIKRLSAPSTTPEA